MWARALRGRKAQTTTTSAGRGMGSGPSLRFSLLVSLLVLPVVLLALALSSRGTRQATSDKRVVNKSSLETITINTPEGPILVELFPIAGPEAKKRGEAELNASTLFSVMCKAGFYDVSSNYFDEGEKGFHVCGGPDKQVGEDRLIQMVGRRNAHLGGSSFDPRKRADFGLLVENRYEYESDGGPGFLSGRFMIVLSDDLDFQTAASKIIELRHILDEMSKDKVYNARMRQYGLPQSSILFGMYHYTEEEFSRIQQEIDDLASAPRDPRALPTRDVPPFIRLGRVIEGLDVADRIAAKIRYYNNHGSVMIRPSTRVPLDIE